MADRDDVCVLLPTYNEAETIASVVSGFRDQGFEEILVIDGGSTDGTQDLAESAGARVVTQSGSGKGQAVREAVQRHIEQPYVLMADGDATYRPEEADTLLEPLLSGRAAHIIGNRFADMQPGAMTKLNQFGNRIINKAFGVIHGRNLTDILSGYRAFTRESFQRCTLTAEGFGIETEMAVECVKHNISTAVVPITYEPRPDESDTNLRPFRDGATIILTLYQMAKTNNPLFYFGSVGLGSTAVGIGLGGFVVYDWVFNGISHEVLAVVGSFGILLGIQLLMFGVLSDMLVAVNREQTRRLEDIAYQLSGESRPGRSTGFGTDAVEFDGAERESDGDLETAAAGAASEAGGGDASSEADIDGASSDADIEDASSEF